MPFFVSTKRLKIEYVYLASSAILLTFVFFFTHSIDIENAVEDGMYAIAPSAERSYAFGTKHFDSKDPREYNIARAEYFFLQTLKHDSQYPFTQHQLARIAFLRGDYFLALTRINSAIESPYPAPSSYYVRALIKGYMDDFDGAAADYQKYITTDSTNWAATNDLAWVLLKANRPKEALDAINKIINAWPDNAWLLNNKSIALSELGRAKEAYESAKAAAHAIENVSESDWSFAYPGNDPLVAKEGLVSFKKAVLDNVHTIELALTKDTKSMQ